MMRLIKNVTASERAYSEIKNMIARRELSPGGPLVAQSLANRLGVSRTPVVEALRRLERDGLVTASPQWGASVKEWSREEVFEAHCIRRALDGEAARLFVLRARPEDKRRLVELNRLFDKFAASDTVKCDEADIELHLHIIRSTGLPRLYELVENSKIETAIISGMGSALIQDPSECAKMYKNTIGCHKALVKALLGKDPEKATREAWKLVDSSLEVIMEREEELKKSNRQAAGK